jgi:hypothetical protein
MEKKWRLPVDYVITKDHELKWTINTNRHCEERSTNFFGRKIERALYGPVGELHGSNS